MVKRRAYGMAHDPWRVTKLSSRMRSKQLAVEVQISRAVGGAFKATACVRQRRRGGGQHDFDARSLSRCSNMRAGKSPTEAAGNALRDLGESLKGR